jgi:polyhydroxybutyrate depolymerase
MLPKPRDRILMMHHLFLAIALTIPAQKDSPAWDVVRTLTVDGLKRSYHFHLPKNYDLTKPTPVVVVLHGAGTNGKIMEHFCGMTTQADKAGFIVVYPNGTGAADLFLTWNAGAFPGPLNGKRPNDITFLDAVLDDLAKVANVDAKRTYVCGMSNGGMMAYRAAAELSHRFAAMANVAGTIVTDKWQPKHPMPVLHIHGTDDPLVPFKGGDKVGPQFLRFPSVEANVKTCCHFNGCDETPKVTDLPKVKDKYKVTQSDYGKGKNGAEVVLYVIDGGGHTWPGRTAPTLLGPATYNLVANEVIWDFLRRYTRE